MSYTEIDLGRGVRFRIWPEARAVTTVYPDGVEAHATREDTEANRAQAAEQGYTGPGAVFLALAEHEALHTLVSRRCFGRESRVLRHFGGGEQSAYALHLHEEAVVISTQRARNGVALDPILTMPEWVTPRRVGGVLDPARGPFTI